MVENETNIWKNLKHNNILQLHSVVESDDAYFVISEIASGGSLLSYLKMNPDGIPIVDARNLFRDIVYAVKYLHDLKLVHRDIKCENILLANAAECIPNEKFKKSLDDFTSNSKRHSHHSSNIFPELFSDEIAQEFDRISFASHEHKRSIDIKKFVAKLADFGLTTYYDKPVLENASPCGSVHYCSPEEINQTSEISPISDIWSLGCVLYAMVTGNLPFDDDFLPRLQNNILIGKFDTVLLKGSVKDLISRMLDVDMKTRITIDEILVHEFIKNDF